MQLKPRRTSQDHAPRLPRPAVSDGFSRFTLLMIALSILVPIAFLGFAKFASPLLSSTQMDWVTFILLIATYVIRVVATFGALWAALAVVRWFIMLAIRRAIPLGHAAAVVAAGVYGLWFLPAALIMLPLSPSAQLMLGTLSCCGLLVLGQVCHRFWPQVLSVTAAG